ncbi:MBL fold metallo-hydrolase RNA specificity domain-containing protein [candidate division CSSED10-310 bacterium]|uniref:MBL fold metallo-hydrolase RNA specificity domain-containing protein n=1 Tax=candidate division CSSED10-310 bacterium TaxID=2855610 RepID=A0ABV6YXS1_UNCC1
MATISFYGAAGTVTGSRFLLELRGRKILIDCGLFQGRKKDRLKNWDSFPVPPAEIDRVFVTHAHIDHSGYLPRFVKEGYSGHIHCTYATHDLCKIMLRDSAHLQEEDARWANKKGFSKHSPALPLYTADDAEQALSLFYPLHYGEEFLIGDKTRVKFKDAGHILGSSFIDIKTHPEHEAKKILFSGDFGRSAKLILKEPGQVYNVDYLVLESTYGDRLHKETSLTEELIRVITESADRGGVLLIPAFAVGRTQSLLFMIRELEEKGKIPVQDVYVDSPMAINVTSIFSKRISDLNIQTRVLALQGKHVFHPRRINFCRSRDQSKAINNKKSGAIVISASGMATGGRILHHLKKRLPNANDTMLFIGYQAEGTRGRTILEGKPSVKIHGEHIPIKAKVEQIMGFSGHADYNEILAWLMGFNRAPEKTFIVHGSPAASESLAQKIRAQFGWDVVVAEFGSSHELNL